MSSEFYRFKICVFGDGGVGKTTLVNRYLKGVFDEDIEMTFGMEFYVKKLELEGIQCSLQVWDFAGEREFRSLLPSSVINSAGGIFMFDISRYSTVKNITEWVGIFQENNIPARYSPVLLVGGKSDLEEHRVISKQDAFQIAGKHEFFDYLECSSKTGEHVEKVFTTEKVFKSSINRLLLIASISSFIGSLLFALNALVVIPTRLTILLKGGFLDKFVDNGSFYGTIFLFILGIILFISLAIRSLYSSFQPKLPSNDEDFYVG